MGYVTYRVKAMNMKVKEIESGRSSRTFLWTFPRSITFESTSSYSIRFGDVDLKGHFVFDLSNTDEVHSSFIGFLLDMKRKIENQGGSFRLQLSTSLDYLFYQLNLQEHFILEAC